MKKDPKGGSAVGRALDSVARAAKIGGLEKKDGSYVATSDLSPEDKKKIEKLGKIRDVTTGYSPALNSVAEAITGRKAADVQKEINNIYAASGKRKARGGVAKAYAKGGSVSKRADGIATKGKTKGRFV
jgi:hypothetical protein